MLMLQLCTYFDIILILSELRFAYHNMVGVPIFDSVCGGGQHDWPEAHIIYRIALLSYMPIVSLGS